MDRLLTCKFDECEKFFLEPVILPCNNTICKEHIDEIMRKTDRFICQFCNDEHLIPNNGFMPNQDYIDALNLDLHLSDKAKELKKLLRKLEESMKELEQLNTDPNAYIEEYFANIINRVELQRDKLKLRVDIMSDELMDKLRSFETNLSQQTIEQFFDNANSNNNDSNNNFEN